MYLQIKIAQTNQTLLVLVKYPHFNSTKNEPARSSK